MQLLVPPYVNLKQPYWFMTRLCLKLSNTYVLYGIHYYPKPARNSGIY